MSCPNPPKGTCPRLPVVQNTVARRTILQSGVAGALALSIPACGMSTDAGLGGQVPAGNVSDLTVDSLARVQGANAFIGLDASGLYAMSAVCTHAGCILGVRGSPGAEAIACGCHGSQFDGNGAVVRGPAGRPLQHYQVVVDGAGAITIQGDTPVDAAVRTPVS